jgi:glycosyltransferase involved in cell wall biosynthesis
MKIVITTDKKGSAIDRLAHMNAKRMDGIETVIIPVHPKRPDEESLNLFLNEIKNADIWDVHYWKTGVKLLTLFPEETKNIKKILTHQNEHNIEGDWEWKNFEWDIIVAKNEWQKKKLEAQGYKVEFIRHAIEFDNFKWTFDKTRDRDFYEEIDNTVVYVGQIKKVKGVRELLQACRELGYKLLIVGSPSERGYFEELIKDNPGDLTIVNNVPDKELVNYYHKARVYCANSDDGTESGTLPILEAMLSGIPVVSRHLGHTRDFGEHGKNIYFREGHYTDIEDLKTALKFVMENNDVANKIRENAWRTVRQYHPEIQARSYRKLYHKLLWDTPIVSVIMPTCDRYETLIENIGSLSNQTYKNFEVIVCDDSCDVKFDIDSKYKFPVNVVFTNKTQSGEYLLAEARNRGLVESIGEIIVLCDDRLKMHNKAIENFVKYLGTDQEKKWLWGSKGVHKQFVENFSATHRTTIINGGMFNERIEQYGGMTQDINTRFRNLGVNFEYCPDALCEPIVKTHSKSKNRESIIKSKILMYKLYS